MIIKDGFVLRKLPGMNLVMPTGKNVKTFNGTLMLNDTAAFIFEHLQKGRTEEETAEKLASKYGLTEAKAKADVLKTVEALAEAGVVTGIPEAD